MCSLGHSGPRLSKAAGQDKQQRPRRGSGLSLGCGGAVRGLWHGILTVRLAMSIFRRSWHGRTHRPERTRRPHGTSW